MTTDNDKVQITVWVSPDRKQQWTEYAEEEYGEGKMSHLIRQAVTEKIKRPETPQTTTQSESQFDGSRIEAMSRAINRIEDTTNKLNSDINTIRRATAQPSVDVKEITNDVYAILPDIKPHSIDWRAHMDRIRPPTDSVDEAVEWLKEEDREAYRDEQERKQLRGEQTAWTGTPDEIQDVLTMDVSTETVREACEQLKRDTARVRSGINEDGESFYWRDE